MTLSDKSKKKLPWLWVFIRCLIKDADLHVYGPHAIFSVTQNRIRPETDIQKVDKISGR